MDTIGAVLTGTPMYLAAFGLTEAQTQALCDATSPRASQQEQIASLLAAQQADPDPAVKDFLWSLSGLFPSTRPALVRAVAANAGIEHCGLVDLR